MFCSNDVSDVFLQSIFQGLMKKKSYKIYICFKNFSAYDIKQNSTWRELFATQLALQSFASKISNESVRLIGLNQYNTQILVCFQIFLKTIIVIVSTASACINQHSTSNSSKIATGRMFIFVFTNSALRFPLGVCIDMAEVATGCIGLHFSRQYLF